MKISVKTPLFEKRLPEEGQAFISEGQPEIFLRICDKQGGKILGKRYPKSSNFYCINSKTGQVMPAMVGHEYAKLTPINGGKIFEEAYIL